MDACSKCHEVIEPGFDRCWKCGTHVDGSPASADFKRVDVDAAGVRALDCLRCQQPMQFVRRMKFHEGSRLSGVLGDLGHLLDNREEFDAYACSGCGKLEFFLPG